MHSGDLHTEKFTSGSDTYFFDIKKDGTGRLYLKISFSKKVPGGFEHHRLTIFNKDMLDFVFALKKSVAKLDQLSQEKKVRRKSKI